MGKHGADLNLAIRTVGPTKGWFTQTLENLVEFCQPVSHPAALLDQRPPNTKQILEQARQGTLRCHPSRQELSAQGLAKDLQHSVFFSPVALGAARGMVDNAGERLQQWLRTAKQGEQASVTQWLLGAMKIQAVMAAPRRLNWPNCLKLLGATKNLRMSVRNSSL